MSNATRVVALAAVSTGVAVVLVLSGTFGLGLALVAVSLAAAVVVLAVAGLLWKGRRSEPASERSRLSSRGVVAFGMALGLVGLVVMFVVAEGEARDHAFLHHLFGLVYLVLFAAVAWAWRTERGTGSSALRSVLLAVLGVAFAAAFVESIGAAGYDELNAGRRIDWLTTLHNATAPVGAVGVLAIPAAVVAVVVALVRRGGRRPHLTDAQSCSGRGGDMTTFGSFQSTPGTSM